MLLSCQRRGRSLAAGTLPPSPTVPQALLVRDSIPRGLQVPVLATIKTEGSEEKVKFLQKALHLPLSHWNAQLSLGWVNVAETMGRTSEPWAPCPGLTGSGLGVTCTRKSRCAGPCRLWTPARPQGWTPGDLHFKHTPR